MDAVLPAEVRDGDLLLFNMGVYAGHVGLAGTHPVYGVASCVHAYLPRGEVVEERLDPLRQQMTGAFRWREG
jgi:hypothetical protein